jgi:hypothetical protein
MPIPHPLDTLLITIYAIRRSRWRWAFVVALMALVAYLEYLGRLPAQSPFHFP